MTVIFLCLSLKIVLKIRYEKTRVEFIPLIVIAFYCNDKDARKEKGASVCITHIKLLPKIRGDQVSEKDYIEQIVEMAWLLEKEDLRFLKRLYTMMYHYIRKRKKE